MADPSRIKFAEQRNFSSFTTYFSSTIVDCPRKYKHVK
jgi:hypothetical protein